MPYFSTVGLAITAFATLLPQAQAADWAAHNRSLGLTATALVQNYREADTQGRTVDGSLNTERGTVGSWTLQARWQGTLGPVPLWLQAGTQRAQGQTGYSGYLQRGNTLTPFQAKTGNSWRSHSLTLGVPHALGDAGRLQAVPHLQWVSQQWQRNLVQYAETYRHRSAGAGLLLQWAATERLTLEAGAARRWQSRASVAAPAFDFAAQQGRGIETELSAAARWHLGSRWHVQASATSTRFRNGASPVVEGLQAPPNDYHTGRYALGVGFVY